MKKLIFLICMVMLTICTNAQKNNTTTNTPADFQPKFGFKAGYNWSYITGSSEGFNKDTRDGFMVSAFFAPPAKGVGYRTELVFSRQGYTYDDGGKNTDVALDYIYLPQLTTYTIGNRLQLQLGAQLGLLLNAKKVSETQDSSILGIMKRIDYGFAAGLELYPFKKLIIGGRYNLGLGKLYKQTYDSPNPYPLPFNPETANFKNSMIQVFAGYRF
jgi:hypothetical protein